MAKILASEKEKIFYNIFTMERKFHVTPNGGLQEEDLKMSEYRELNIDEPGELKEETENREWHCPHCRDCDGVEVVFVAQLTGDGYLDPDEGPGGFVNIKNEYDMVTLEGTVYECRNCGEELDPERDFR
jgi:DNA-directed RNA polymerase subunit RPC12/RpoP